MKTNKIICKKLILLTFITLLNLAANSQTNNFLTYSNSDYHFSIQYPQNWQRNYDLLSGCVFMAQDPQQTATINVVITNNVRGTINDITMEKLNMKASQSSSNMRVVSERSLLVNNCQGKEFICVFSINGNNLKNRVYYFMKDRVQYTITISSLEVNYEKIKNIASSMINSLKFI